MALADPGEQNIAVTGDGVFAFTATVAGGTPYQVTIATQPTGQECTIANGSGTVSANVTSISIACVTLNEWVWKGGAQTAASPGVYGTKGTAASGNVPGARQGQALWLDGSGNLWIFGGNGVDADGNVGDLNDLWKYTPATNEWTWEGGSSTVESSATYGTQGIASASNIPGARDSATTWTDSSGNFWLFGGLGCASTVGRAGVGELNDLWEFSPTTGLWTYVAGSQGVNDPGSTGTKGEPSPSNRPTARNSAQGWIDQSGNLWIYAGYGSYLGELNDPIIFSDLWEYSLTAKSWIWQTGSQLGAATGPTSRQAAVTWVDSSGKFWLFGGSTRVAVPSGIDNEFLSDMWEFDPTTLTWKFVSGPGFNPQNGTTETDIAGNYGTQGVPASSNIPGARAASVSWLDTQGNLWVFGGAGIDGAQNSGELNDLWRYNQTSKMWTWMGGSQKAGTASVFGTLGVADVNNTPGGRSGATGAIDPSGNVWLFGGYENTGNQSGNDLWEYSTGP